jgi:hypothetical protein
LHDLQFKFAERIKKYSGNKKLRARIIFREREKIKKTQKTRVNGTMRKEKA